MRIVHICDGFLPLVGGSITHNYSAVRYLSDRGHDVEVVTFVPEKRHLFKIGYDKDTYEELKSENHTLPELEGVKIHAIYPRRIYWYYDLWKKIKEIEREGKVDVFDVHLMHYAVPLLNRKNVVLSLHYWDPVCPYIFFPQKYKPDYFLLDPSDRSTCFRECARCVGRFKYLKWRFLRWQAMRRIRRYIVKKTHYRDPMERRGIEPKKIEFVPFWIDSETIRQRCSSSGYSLKGIDPSETVFAFVGRLEDAKGPFLALQAFLQLRGSGGNTALVFFGDGSLRKDLECFCRTHNLSDSVHFLGRVPHPEIYDYFSLVDVFLHTERYEYGWALLECMSTGRPVIGLNTGKTPEILKDEVNAYLSDPTPESLCEKMKIAMENPKLSKEVARGALRTIRSRYSLSNLERYERILQEIATSCR